MAEFEQVVEGKDTQLAGYEYHTKYNLKIVLNFASWL
jgi:hypothetical protein